MNAMELQTVGWREWISLPQLNIKNIKAKMDTGARTSALHAFKLETFTERGIQKIKFDIHPLQRNTKKVISCIATLKEHRVVSDSGGHREKRPVIETQLQIGHFIWPIEITLTSRDDMRFRMLIGRTAMLRRLQVNPQASYLLGKKPT